jgi:hypothetical protein
VTAAALMLAAPTSNDEVSDVGDRGAIAADLDPVPPLSAGARDRVLAGVQSRGLPNVPNPRRVAAPAPASLPIAPLSASQATASRRPVRFRWLALAAAAVLLVFVAGALLGAPLGLVNGTPNTDELRSALAASGRILEQPNHRQAALVDREGTPVGSVLIDGEHGDIVVLSTGGDDGENATAEYHCYLIRGDDPRTWLGEMVAQAGTSVWAGHVDDVTDLGRPGDVILVVDDGTSPEFTATF